MTCACESVHPFPCQFPAETEFFGFDGREWCRFHLPLQDAAGNNSAKGRRDNGWETTYVGLLAPGNTNGPIGGVKKGKELEAFRTEIQARLRAAKKWDNPLLDDSRADLRGVAFPDGFDFTGIADVLHVNFEHATFGDRASFLRATFGDGADFKHTTFGEGAEFNSATFGDGAEFNWATFGNGASFSRATFGDWVIFNSATFGDGASFLSATFGDWAHFNGVIFQGDGDFSAGTKMEAKSDFMRIDFDDATFKGPCVFKNRAFTTSANFNGAVFHDLVEFHGCTFHPGMSFHLTKFRKTKEDKLSTKKDNDDATERLERSYRTLKVEMEKLRARNEEADFFALEMECRRQRGSVPWFERFAATAYKHLSDYGRSIVRPLAWLIPLTFFAFLIYRDLGACHAAAFRDGSEILEFTLEQMFSPSKVWFSPSGGEVVHKDLEDLLSQYPPLVKILASLQSLATITLLTLFLLALRRRFKMD